MRLCGKPMNDTKQSNPPTIKSPTPSQCDWNEARILVRSDLVFQAREQGGRPVTLIGDPARNKFFQIGLYERAVIETFDGVKTIVEIAANSSVGLTTEQSQNQVAQIARWLIQNNLGSIAGTDNGKRISEKAKLLKQGNRLGLSSLISFKVPLFNPTRVLSSLSGVGKIVFHPLSVVVWSVVVTVALVMLWQRSEEIGLSYVGVLTGTRWMWLLAIWVCLKIVHEMGHGLACRRYGGDVPEAGVLLLVFAPLAYMNVTSSWRLANRWQRIVVSFGGMYVELFLAALAAIGWALLESDSLLKDLCFNTFTMAGITTVLFNANPLMRFDGYYILSDVCDIPNLYGKGTAWYWDRIRAICLGWIPTNGLVEDRERWIVPIFGSLSALWRGLVGVGLLIAAGVLFHGVGIALAVLAGFSWYVLPAIKAARQIATGQAAQPINRRRVAIVAFTFGLIAFMCFWIIGSPASSSAPAIVQFQNETILRASCNGFIDEILVHDGQAVVAGQSLVIQRNEILATDVELLNHQKSESDIQAKVYLKACQLANYQAELEKSASLLRQLGEKQRQLAELTICSPFDGIVMRRNLSELSGSFVKQGEPILTIACHDTPEIIVSIDQHDFASIQADATPKLKAVFPGLPLLHCQLTTKRPRATTVPAHPAMCADRGGPLAVRHVVNSQKKDNGQSQVELLSPHFNLELSIPNQYRERMMSGQQGIVIFPVARHSIGTYWYLAARACCIWKLTRATPGL